MDSDRVRDRWRRADDHIFGRVVHVRKHPLRSRRVLQCHLGRSGAYDDRHLPVGETKNRIVFHTSSFPAMIASLVVWSFLSVFLLMLLGFVVDCIIFAVAVVVLPTVSVACTPPPPTKYLPLSNLLICCIVSTRTQVLVPSQQSLCRGFVNKVRVPRTGDSPTILPIDPGRNAQFTCEGVYPSTVCFCMCQRV